MAPEERVAPTPKRLRARVSDSVVPAPVLARRILAAVDPVEPDIGRGGGVGLQPLDLSDALFASPLKEQRRVGVARAQGTCVQSPQHLDLSHLGAGCSTTANKPSFFSIARELKVKVRGTSDLGPPSSGSGPPSFSPGLWKRRPYPASGCRPHSGCTQRRREPRRPCPSPARGLTAAEAGPLKTTTSVRGVHRRAQRLANQPKVGPPARWRLGPRELNVAVDRGSGHLGRSLAGTGLPALRGTTTRAGAVAQFPCEVLRPQVRCTPGRCRAASSTQGFTPRSAGTDPRPAARISRATASSPDAWARSGPR